MSREKIKLEKELMDKVRKLAALEGYASAEEFVVHCLEREIARRETPETEEEIKKKLKGLGYIS